jgi:hypothetical protein
MSKNPADDNVALTASPDVEVDQDAADAWREETSRFPGN